MKSEEGMTKGKWFVIFFLAICVDLGQLVLDAFLIGIGVNRIIDLIVGLSLPFYFHMNGVSMADPKRALSMLATFGLEFFPGMDALPLWTLDVAFIYSTSKAKEIVENASPETLNRLTKVAEIAQKKLTNRKQPLNQNRVRLPPPPSERGRIQPLTSPQTPVNNRGRLDLGSLGNFSGPSGENSKKSSDDEMSLSA